MSNNHEQESVPSEFNLKSYVEEWYLLQIYGHLTSFKGKGNHYHNLIKKRMKQGGIALGVIFGLNILLTFIPVFSIILNNIIRIALLAGLPLIAIWVYIAQKKDKTDEEQIYNPPLLEENSIDLYQTFDDAIYVNYYNRQGYWYHLDWEDVVYAEIVPTQIHLGSQSNKITGRERNKLLLSELNRRFQIAEEQVEELPYDKKVIRDDMVSIELVTRNGVNLLPIPPSWIAEGFVEDLLIYIDGKINERFYIKSHDIDNIAGNFPYFYQYIESTIIKRQRIVEDFKAEYGYTTEDLKNKVKDIYSKVKGKLRGENKNG